MTLDLVLVHKGMKLTELSEKTGISIQNLSVLKTNKGKAVRFSTLEALCDALSCLPGDLLDYDGERSKEIGEGN